jgi:hypothetical protein
MKQLYAFQTSALFLVSDCPAGFICISRIGNLPGRSCWACVVGEPAFLSLPGSAVNRFRLSVLLYMLALLSTRSPLSHTLLFGPIRKLPQQENSGNYKLKEGTELPRWN